MKTIVVYDYEAMKLSELADNNDCTVAELIEMMMEFIDQVKAYYKLK